MAHFLAFWRYVYGKLRPLNGCKLLLNMCGLINFNEAFMLKKKKKQIFKILELFINYR